MRTPKTWLSNRAKQTLMLGLVAVGAAGVVALSPTAAHAAEGSPAPASSLAGYDPALQPNGYYCGPAATRIALSAHGMLPSFDQLAADLGTTQNGTNSINDLTRVLNKHHGEERYRSVMIGGPKASPEQVEQLRANVVNTVSAGDAVVANIAGTVTDTAGESHSYQGGHYLTVTGYGDEGRTVRITDSADTVGSNEYQLPVEKLANWIATRGYTA